MAIIPEETWEHVDKGVYLEVMGVARQMFNDGELGSVNKYIDKVLAEGLEESVPVMLWDDGLMTLLHENLLKVPQYESIDGFLEWLTSPFLLVSDHARSAVVKVLFEKYSYLPAFCLRMALVRRRNGKSAGTWDVDVDQTFVELVEESKDWASVVVEAGGEFTEVWINFMNFRRSRAHSSHGVPLYLQSLHTLSDGFSDTSTYEGSDGGPEQGANAGEEVMKDAGDGDSGDAAGLEEGGVDGGDETVLHNDPVFTASAYTLPDVFSSSSLASSSTSEHPATETPSKIKRKRGDFLTTEGFLMGKGGAYEASSTRGTSKRPHSKTSRTFSFWDEENQPKVGDGLPSSMSRIKLYVRQGQAETTEWMAMKEERLELEARHEKSLKHFARSGGWEACD